MMETPCQMMDALIIAQWNKVLNAIFEDEFESNK